MGRNFVSVCGRCKVTQWHLRGEESQGMHEFYCRHAGCLKIDSGSVLTLCDRAQEDVIDDLIQGKQCAETEPVVLTKAELKKEIEDIVARYLRKAAMPGGLLRR